MRAIACGFALALCGLSVVLAQDATGRQFALLVGVSNYKGTDLSSLRFTENDAADLATVLNGAGFRRVVLMTRAEAFRRQDDELFPTAANIRLQIEALLKNRQPGDTVVLDFSGHGVEPKGAKGLFFCPEKADLAKTDTLVSLAEVQDALKACPAGVKLLIADACRNDPAGGKSAVVDKLESVTRPELPKPPQGVVMLFSCRTGQKAFESERLKRGYLFHAVIEGLKGQAAGRSGEVDLLGLATYAVNEVPEWVREDYGARAEQVPQLLGDVTGRVVLVKSAGPPKDPTKLDLGGGATIDLALIQPGSFVMGSYDGNPDERPPHSVRISQPFYLGKTEVTRGQFRRFVADTGYRTEGEADGRGGFGLMADGQWEQKPEYTWEYAGWPQTDAHPVVNVSYADATKFCEWLSRKSNRKVVLPSEAQWEYACRAGTTTKFSFGNDIEQLFRYGNGSDASAKRRFPHWITVAGDGFVFTAPVGRYRPNAWGLYDMHGNVWEHCRDGKRTYANRTETDPEGPAAGERVSRGGPFLFTPTDCRSACRGYTSPGPRRVNLGFRVAVQP